MRYTNLSIAFIYPFSPAFSTDTLDMKAMGGAEAAVASMARDLATIGHDVQVFNGNTITEGFNFGDGSATFHPLAQIENYKEFDIVISVRSIVPFLSKERAKEFSRGFNLPDFSKVRAKYRVIWRHDTFVDGDYNMHEVMHVVDEVYTLSDWHTEHTLEHLDVPREKIWQTRNGINYYNNYGINKDPDLFIWNAAANKGLRLLLEEIWPKVKELIPSAKLVVIGGYYEGIDDDNSKYVKDWTRKDEYLLKCDELDITFTGLIPAEEVSEYCAEATYMIYPPTFPETFGISTLEAQVYGAIPITYDLGALQTTAFAQGSFKCSLNPLDYPDAFVAEVFEAYNSSKDHETEYLTDLPVHNYTWDAVATEWHEHFENILNIWEEEIMKDPIEEKSILIAIPTAVRIECETFKSIYDLEIPEGYRTDFQFFWCYMIDQGRNQIANYAIQNGYDYVLAIDADIEVPKDALVKMLAHDKDMVAGIYRMRRPEEVIELYDVNFHQVPKEAIAEGKLMEVGGAGFGCVLVKTKVFEEVGYPQFFYHQAYKFSDVFSEDNDFFMKARDIGYKLYADTSIRCRHKGTVMWEITQ